LKTKKPLFPVWTKNLIEKTIGFDYIKNLKENKNGFHEIIDTCKRWLFDFLKKD
jgi:hypothetical protein